MKWISYILLSLSLGCMPEGNGPSQVIFDIPNLYSKNIDEVRHVLGPPLNDPPDPLHPRIDEHSNTYRKDGHSLVISYDIYSRRIKEFFLSSGEQYKNPNDLLRIGNLDSTDISTYSIEVEPPFYTSGYTSFTVSK